MVADSRGEEVEEGEEVVYELTTQPIWTEEARRTKIDGGAGRSSRRPNNGGHGLRARFGRGNGTAELGERWKRFG